MNKKYLRIIIVLVSILAVILLMISLYFYGLTSVSSKSDKVRFTVESGMSTKEVIDSLKESNIIKSRISSYIYVKLHRPVIQAGVYELDRKNNTRQILKKLSSGDAIKDTIIVTFIEGYRIPDYVKLISEKFGYSESEILAKMSDIDYLNKLISQYEFLDESILNKDIYYPLEGYMFPAKYEFYKDASIETIIETTLNKMREVLNEYKNEIDGSGYSIHEILTMASIIENETKLDVDRANVSQVIRKRLEAKMNLGMDVTTYYGVRKNLTETLTKVDLNSNNAYNTRNAALIGLPIGPISNPRKDSIKAALSPSDTNYLYFYAEMDSGKLHFAENYNEFLELKKIYG